MSAIFVYRSDVYHAYSNTSSNKPPSLDRETTDFSSAETLLKNFTLFIPENLLQGTKFMQKLNLSDKEAVRYTLKSGKRIDKMLFDDLSVSGQNPKSKVHFDEERYNGMKQS